MYVPSATSPVAQDTRDPALLKELRDLRECGSVVAPRRLSEHRLRALAQARLRTGSVQPRTRAKSNTPAPPLPPRVPVPREQGSQAETFRGTQAERAPPPHVMPVSPLPATSPLLDSPLSWDASIPSRGVLAISQDGTLATHVGSAHEPVLVRSSRPVARARARGTFFWEMRVESQFDASTPLGRASVPTLLFGVCTPDADARVNPKASVHGWYFSLADGAVYHGGSSHVLSRTIGARPTLGAVIAVQLEQPGGRMEIFLDGEPVGLACTNVPGGVHAAVVLCQPREAIRICSYSSREAAVTGPRQEPACL
mmetsp:Transcript_13396/g.39475  ORF Transcript_13396/g.39475 Transcript_13396/m.39475 type:complete len:311 (-) Transcript_13396:120-1052(-)